MSTATQQQTSAGTTSGSVTPAQQQAVLSALGGAQTAYGTSASTIPNLSNEYGIAQSAGNSQTATGTNDVLAGSTGLQNAPAGVLGAANLYMSGYDPAAQTQAALQGATQEANQVVMPGIASGAAQTGNVNSTGTGVASGIVKDNLAQQYATDYGNISSQDYSNALNNAYSTVLGANTSLLNQGNSAITSGTATGAGAAAGATAAPLTSISDYLSLLDNANAGGTSTGTSTGQATTTTNPSALQIIGGLMSSGGSLATGIGNLF